MSRWDDYKEKRERQRYFRSNNDMYLDSGQWLKTIAFGLIVAIIAGIFINYVGILLGFNSSIFYILLGYVVSYAVKYASGVESRQMGIVSVIFTLIGSIFAVSASLIFYGYGIGIVGAVMYTFRYMMNDIFLLVCIVIGCFFAYYNAS